MLFSNLLPDWNSLDAVRRAHSDLELTSIVFFGVLAFFDVLAHMTSDKGKEKIFGAIGLVFFVLAVACEGVAYTYGQQNDKLSEGVIRSLASTSGQAAKDSQTAIANSGVAESTAAGAEKKAEGARQEADSFEKDIALAKQQAADAEAHLAGAEQRAAKAESDFAKAQVELARLTGAVQSVPVVDGVAEPDPMKGLRLRIVLHTNVKIKLPTLPKGKAVTWTLFIVQDEKGNHQFSTFPTNVMFGNFLQAPPHSFCNMEFVSDEHGTTDVTFGSASCPANQTDTTSK